MKDNLLANMSGNKKKSHNHIKKHKVVNKEDELIDITNNVIDDIFLNDEHKCIKDLDPKEQKDITEIDEEIFQEKKKGINLFSKKQNKHMFRLLQIFGYRNETMISFIDKDHMKMRYMKAM